MSNLGPNFYPKLVQISSELGMNQEAIEKKYKFASNIEVTKVNTPISQEELVKSFLEIGKEIIGKPLSKKQVAIIVAQNNLETGNRKYMYNFNIGNIMHTSADNWNYFISGDRTRNAKGEWVPFKAKFRAYPDLNSGVKDYLNNLKNRGNGQVWKTILAEDPVAFSKALKKTKYYEADEEDTVDPKTGKKVPGYTSIILSQFNNFNKSDSFEKSQSLLSTNVPKKSNIIENVDLLMDSILKSLPKIAENKFLQKIAYQNCFLPQQFLINVKTSSFENSLEFARIICLAIDEEMQGESSIYSDNKNVEIEATIYGPKSLCNEALVQLCQATSELFEVATKKIGSIQAHMEIYKNKSSNYQELDIKTAIESYNNFHQKFRNK